MLFFSLVSPLLLLFFSVLMEVLEEIFSSSIFSDEMLAILYLCLLWLLLFMPGFFALFDILQVLFSPSEYIMSVSEVEESMISLIIPPLGWTESFLNWVHTTGSDSSEILSHHMFSSNYCYIFPTEWVIPDIKVKVVACFALVVWGGQELTLSDDWGGNTSGNTSSVRSSWGVNYPVWVIFLFSLQASHPRALPSSVIFRTLEYESIVRAYYYLPVVYHTSGPLFPPFPYSRKSPQMQSWFHWYFNEMQMIQHRHNLSIIYSTFPNNIGITTEMVNLYFYYFNQANERATLVGGHPDVGLCRGLAIENVKSMMSNEWEGYTPITHEQCCTWCSPGPPAVSFYPPLPH